MAPWMLAGLASELKADRVFPPGKVEGSGQAGRQVLMVLGQGCTAEFDPRRSRQSRPHEQLLIGLILIENSYRRPLHQEPFIVLFQHCPECLQSSEHHFRRIVKACPSPVTIQKIKPLLLTFCTAHSTNEGESHFYYNFPKNFKLHSSILPVPETYSVSCPLPAPSDSSEVARVRWRWRRAQTLAVFGALSRELRGSICSDFWYSSSSSSSNEVSRR